MELFDRGVKVLSLFFIDEMARYQDYFTVDGKGEYAEIFEEEYTKRIREVLDNEFMEGDAPYAKYLRRTTTDRTHSGYFSIGKKSKRLTDPKAAVCGENVGLSDDIDAYGLILRDKEQLLSLAEPTRFIFSHSALREDWDNPNVFAVCTLKYGDNTISRRQEVGRGPRLSVNQNSERMDHPFIVHDTNVLTVMASESYKDSVTALQKDISDSLSVRPYVANKAYFTGKVLNTREGPITVSDDQATDIEFYLIRNGYTDKRRNITEKYHQTKKNSTLEALPDGLQPYAE